MDARPSVAFITYYHHEALGSARGLTDQPANVAQAYLYDEFGNLTESWGSIPNHYLYTGQEWDSEIAGTGLYNLRARYYEPTIGRFVSEDPEVQSGDPGTRPGCTGCRVGGGLPSWFMYRGDPQELNAYPYVLNNPVNLSDPSGEKVQVCDLLLRLEGIHQYIRFEGGPYSGQTYGFVQREGSSFPPRWQPAMVRSPETGGWCWDATADDCNDACVYGMIKATKPLADAGILRYHLVIFNCRHWVLLVLAPCKWGLR